MTEYRILEKWPAYRVGSDGSIWTRWRLGPNSNMTAPWREMNPGLDRDGYRRVDLRSQGRPVVTRKVSALVCDAFHGPRPTPAHVCRHDNGIANDDRADNLLWGTTLENTDDRRRHGTIAAGLRHGRCKLPQETIDEILALKGTTTQLAAANQFGISRGYVGQLWNGSRARVSIQMGERTHG